MTQLTCIDQLSYALNTRNQNESANINETVKIITVATLVYLPGSFLGVCARAVLENQKSLIALIDPLWNELFYVRP